MQDQEDVAAVAQAAAGDTSAFEVLVTRYQGVLFRVAFRMLGDYDDARDATQSAFIKTYQKLGTFDPRFRFFSWIYRILLNECLNVQARPATARGRGDRTLASRRKPVRSAGSRGSPERWCSALSWRCP